MSLSEIREFLVKVLLSISIFKITEGIHLKINTGIWDHILSSLSNAHNCVMYFELNLLV